MAISIGGKIPNSSVSIMRDGKPATIQTDEIFSDKRVVLFALPGAFTPTCSAAHLPGYLKHAKDFFALGVDNICCLSVNDVFVMNAWGEAQNVGDDISMLADGSGNFTHNIDMTLDLTSQNFGIRSQRYSLYAKNGVVNALYLEEKGGFSVSNAETMLQFIRSI